MAGLGILIARVAKSGNHANLKRLCSCHVHPFVDLSPAMVSDPVAAVKWRAIEVVWGRLDGRQNPKMCIRDSLYRVVPLHAKPAVDPVYLLYGAGFGHCDFDHRLYAVYQRCYGRDCARRPQLDSARPV